MDLDREKRAMERGDGAPAAPLHLNLARLGRALGVTPNCAPKTGLSSLHKQESNADQRGSDDLRKPLSGG